ncbi:MAG: hypothetical protein IH614_01965, partial [Desulfuromonadales bacterium]|nr:hypothetical protein [Desulfuromonadales bacterium]
MKHLLFANVKRGTALLLAILFAATAALTGCSSDSYDEPSSGAISNVAIEGHATNVVIEPATLKGWMDAGLINAPNSFDGRVVILDVTEEALYYSKGHIPGAQLWNMSENYQNRVEGPALSAEMVLDGPSMDKMLQKHGIDERTTIVITSSFNETHKVLRAYAQFRYWGFPKERLKVLNGFNGVWPVDQLTVEVPVVAPSTYSVRQLGTLRSDLRTSLSEMIVAVRSGSHQPIDFRGTAPPFSTPGVFSDVAGDYVVFEGLVVGGKTYDWKKFNVDYAAGKAASGVGSAGFQFKSAADIAADLALAGIDNSKPIITSCRSGNIASAAFF